MAKRIKNKRSAKIMPIIKKALLSRKVLFVLVVVVIFVIFFVGIKNYLYNSECFTIKEVELVGEGIRDSYLSKRLSHIGVGENIFEIDIKDIETSIRRNYSDIKNVQIEKVFPNKLRFCIDKREAVALVNSGYYYPVDREGFILKDVDKTTRPGLVVISGVRIKEKDIGRKCNSPNLAKALLLLENLTKSNILRSNRVSEIDASDSKNLSFYMNEGLQVHIGGEDFKNRLELLKKVLSDPNVDLKTVGYIDLRFENIVIGPK